MAELPSARGNHLLAMLPSAEFEAVAADLTVADVPRRAPLALAGRSFDRAVFPITAVIALVGRDAAGAHVEVAPIGCEGLVGLPMALGIERASSDAIVQIAGGVAFLERATFLRHLARSTALRAVVHRYAAVQLAQLSQAVVCNRLHELEAREARWLLATRDRLGSDEFVLTHELLAGLLGVSRPKVTLASASLQRAGLLDNPRNRFRILDAAGLERAACSCYEAVRAEFERSLGIWGRADVATGRGDAAAPEPAKAAS